MTSSPKEPTEGSTCKTNSCGSHSCSPCSMVKVIMVVIALGLIVSYFIK